MYFVLVYFFYHYFTTVYNTFSIPMILPPIPVFFLQVAWSQFLLPHLLHSCTLIRIWKVMMVRQESPGLIASVENSCLPKTDLYVTAKVLINQKNKERSCYSIQTIPLVSHQRTVHPSSTTRVMTLILEGLTGRQEWPLHLHPWAKMKMHLNLNGGKSCRAMHLKKTVGMYLLYCRERQAIYVPAEPGKGWAFQSSSLRNFPHQNVISHCGFLSLPHCPLSTKLPDMTGSLSHPNTAWHVY